MKKLWTGMALVMLLVVAFANVAVTDDDENGKRGVLRARLSGYQEVPQALSTTGTGHFSARLEDQNGLSYTLRFSGLEGTPTAAHIHFGLPWHAGGVIAFLCGGGGKPACEPDKDITGTIVASDVIGPEAQGIAPSQFDEALRAILGGAAYVNVHSSKYPAGEIRGQIRGRRHGLGLGNPGLGRAGSGKD